MARIFSTPIQLPADPASSNHAANKNYVDTGLSGKANTSHTHAASDVTSGSLDIARIPTGTSSTTVCVGNDSRLSDSRAPSGSAGGALAGTYPNPGLSLCPYTPYTVTFSATPTLDPTAGNNPTITLTGNITALAISTTGALPGQMLFLEVLASGSTRTVTLSGITLTTGLTAGPYSFATGKAGFFGFRYSALLSAWALIAYTSSS